MNYRGAKVNIAGIVTKQQIHKAWLQLDQMKQRGQQYFKGSNCHIISAGYGDIINIVGGKEVKKEEGVEEKKIEILEPYTAYVFVYDEGNEVSYTGFNFIAGTVKSTVGGFYTVFKDSDNPLEIKYKVSGNELSMDGITGGVPVAAASYEISGPNYYTVALSGKTLSVNTSYYISSFLASKEQLEIIADETAGISGSNFDHGEVCDLPTENGESMYYQFDSVLTLYESGTPGVDPVYTGDWSIFDQMNITYGIPSTHCAGLGCITNTYGYVSTLYLHEGGYTANRAYEFMLAPIYRSIEGSGDYGECPGVEWEVTKIEVPGQFPDFYHEISLNYLCGNWIATTFPVNFPVLTILTKELPELGTAGAYISNVQYQGVTKLQDKIMKVYIQGIPPAYKPQVSSGVSTSLYVSVDGVVVYTKLLAAFSSVTFRQAKIYEIENVYVYIISFLTDSVNHNIVIREKEPGEFEDLSDGYDDRYPYLRVAKIQYLTKRTL